MGNSVISVTNVFWKSLDTTIESDVTPFLLLQYLPPQIDAENRPFPAQSSDPVLGPLRFHLAVAFSGAVRSFFGEEMAALLSGKLKRKDLEEVSDEFSDFSLSSPARKIRRLNVELPPIIEGDEPISHPVSNSQLPQGLLQGSHEDISTNVMEERPSSFVNEERALILYKPLNTPPLMQPQNLSSLSVKVNANFAPRFQDQGFWKVKAEQTEKSDASNNSLAVVPWVPSNVQLGMMKESDITNPSFEPMEADEESATMEIEEDTGYVGGETNFANANGIVGAGINRVDDLRQQQWQQQHCMIPNIPPSNSSTPITWSW